MAFTPKLPTWHNTVQVYRQTAGVWAEHAEVVGQVYTPLRNQDDEEGGLLYFQYPVAHAATLRDPFDGVADAIAITYPGGAVKGFRVREVLPRWLGFPNQHLIASLHRLSAAQLAIILADIEDTGAGALTCPLASVVVEDGESYPYVIDPDVDTERWWRATVFGAMTLTLTLAPADVIPVQIFADDCETELSDSERDEVSWFNPSGDAVSVRIRVGDNDTGSVVTGEMAVELTF